MTPSESLRIFDWNKAVRLILLYRVNEAEAGLYSDWDRTGGTILENGLPSAEKDYPRWFGSMWDTPVLKIHAAIIPCWCYANEHPEWSPKSYWPEETVSLLVNNYKPASLLLEYKPCA